MRHKNFILWGYSAAGSAFDWQSKGQGFESPYLHQKSVHESVRIFYLIG